MMSGSAFTTLHEVRMFAIALRREQHTREYAVSPAVRSGWELTLQEDLQCTRRVHFEDWHRVERAVAVVQLEIGQLTSHGWQVEHLRDNLH